MTTILDRESAAGAGSGVAQPEPPDASRGDAPAGNATSVSLRPFVAVAISAAGAGLLTGGIFGSWAARLLGLFAAIFGVAWTYAALRSSRPATVQPLFVPAAFLLCIVSLIPASGGGPSELPRLVGDAIESGRLLRPPVPFDPGWRPILIMLLGSIGFAAAWVAGPLGRPKLGVVTSLPLVGFTLISQPAGDEALAGLIAFVSILGAVAVLFGGDVRQASELGRQFEVKRAVRGVAAGAPLLAGLVLLSNASFLFPEPVYDPGDKPQKPKPVPLSQVRDRVLFEVEADADVTGPWRVGVLDVYDGESWRLPPFDRDRFEPLPADGVLDLDRLNDATITARFTIRDLGDSAALPGLANPARVSIDAGADVVFDPRPSILRVPTGRAPAGLSYELAVPPYPSATDLEAARPATGADVEDFLEVDDPPPVVADLLASAPTNPWRRLDFLRGKLNEVVIATGVGEPVEFTPERVEEIFVGNHEASPFEIVATEALLARWAGIPSRIGFGFDGVNDENGVLTVRPRNAAQFLEVYFDGHGWVPLSSTPPKAKASLDTDPNARFKPTIEPSSDVAVEIYIPFELESLRLLYERIRSTLLQVAPFAALAVALYLLQPAAFKMLRRSRRRRWAAALGPRPQIAVEYAEFRETATDLNVGDPYDTPLEFLWKVQEDDEHEELAWLVSRAMYGDLATTATDEDVRSAEEMSASLRRRIWRAQPLQSRVLAFISRTSLLRPYTVEVPNLSPPRLLPRRRPWARVG